MQMTYCTIGAQNTKGPKGDKECISTFSNVTFRSCPGNQHFHLLDYQWVYVVTVPGVIQTYFLLPRSAID